MGDATVTRPISSGRHDWFQFDLRSTSSLHTTRTGLNHIDLVSADLVLRDTVPPVLTALALPAPTAWHGATACAPFTIRATDQGGGLRRVDVRRSDSYVVTDWVGPLADSLQPGPILQDIGDCIQPSELGHGDTAFTATVYDVSGAASELRFSVRADHQPPVISGGPENTTRFTISQPKIAFDISDAGAGIAHVSATLDGRAVPVQVQGGSAVIDVGQVPIGAHTVAIGVADGAGNGTRIERSFSVADTTPPSLTLASPGPRGDASLWLSIAATDDMSGVDATSWSVTVNGESVAVHADASHLTATLGPLSPGMQRIDVRVRDAAGNEARLSHAYDVVSAPVPSMPNVGSRTGVFLVDAPTGTVLFGRPASVTAYVTRNGRPMPGQLVEVRREGHPLASETTDEHGVARVTFRVARPGKYQAWVSGMAMEPADIALQVAPRLFITTSSNRPKIGQPVRVTGRIFPAIRGRRLSVQARVGGSWYPVRRSASTDGRGGFRSHVVGATKGTVGVRVKLAAVGAWAGGTSNVQVLTVKAPRRKVK
ncbi:MAG: hypothetical protein ABI200_03620, partial [Gaiellales bacterium]